jgi:hypothetical protein
MNKIKKQPGARQNIAFSDDDNRLEKSNFHNRRQAIAQSAASHLTQKNPAEMTFY